MIELYGLLDPFVFCGTLRNFCPDKTIPFLFQFADFVFITTLAIRAFFLLNSYMGWPFVIYLARIYFYEKQSREDDPQRTSDYFKSVTIALLLDIFIFHGAHIDLQ